MSASSSSGWVNELSFGGLNLVQCQNTRRGTSGGPPARLYYYYATEGGLRTETGRCNFISVGMINDDGPQSSSQLLCGEEEGVVAVILSLIPPSKFAERSVHS